jgi:hypothetical protein
VRDRGATRYVDAEYEYDYDSPRSTTTALVGHVSTYDSLLAPRVGRLASVLERLLALDARGHDLGFVRTLGLAPLPLRHLALGGLVRLVLASRLVVLARLGLLELHPLVGGLVSHRLTATNDHWYRSNRSRHGWEIASGTAPAGWWTSPASTARLELHVDRAHRDALDTRDLRS